MSELLASYLTLIDVQEVTVFPYRVMPDAYFVRHLSATNAELAVNQVTCYDQSTIMVSRLMPEGASMCGLIQGCHHYLCRYSPPYINFALLQFHIYCCSLIFKRKTLNGEIVCLEQKEKIGIYKQLLTSGIESSKDLCVI